MHTLLIVEDEKLIRQGLKVMVQRSGVPVENILECGNGEMALEILKRQKVDVMF
ncbi:MAG: response regulator, partial [Lachnospiraceae bacterium]|nr:response regulator [Lachnospiraceae bacterium]